MTQEQIFQDTIRKYIDGKSLQLDFSESKLLELVAKSDYYGTLKDAKQTIITKINQMSVHVHFKVQAVDNFFTRDGEPANTIITSSKIYNNYFKELEYFKDYNEDYRVVSVYENTGFSHVGRLNDRYQVYLHPNCEENKLYLLNKNYYKCGGTITFVE